MKTLTFILLMTYSVFNSQELKTFTFQNLPDKSEKPLLIYMKTSWCSVCKIQMHQIKKDLALIKLLNENVHFIIFDAEKSKEAIEFFGKTYRYFSNGDSGIHELAVALARHQKPIYPTWILIDHHSQILFYQEGLVDRSTLKKILTGRSICTYESN